MSKTGASSPRFQLILIKPSHYDNDGYVVQWLRSTGIGALLLLPFTRAAEGRRAPMSPSDRWAIFWMGVIGFARSVALEGARYNVTSNVIAPGIVGPNANLSPLYERMVKRVAMQREGQPEDIASAIAFLCSERARYITGAVLTVTGGMDLFTF